MSQAAVAGDIEAARQFVSRNAWQEAYDALQKVAKTEQLSGADLNALADSAWWTGRLEESIDSREQAYAQYLKEGESAKAARAAVWLALDHFAKQAHSLAAGWLSRAERLLEDEQDSVESGYLLLVKALGASNMGDYAAVGEAARGLLDIGGRFGDRDLQAYGLVFEGRTLIADGQVEKGLASLDEATVAAVSGELGPLATGVTYCLAITSTTSLKDYRRAGEWTVAAQRWCERQAITGFPGLCRVHRAQIMHLRGSWVEAERDARLAVNELKDFNLDNAAAAFYELGEIRLRMGDNKAAEEAFTQAEALGREAQPGRAMLALEEGNVEEAAATIRRALADETRGPLHRLAFLAPQVEIAIAANDISTAESATEELEAIAETYGTPALAASADYARGSVHIARGEPDEAAKALKRSLSGWKEADVPYEAARARSMLARAHREQGDEGAAVAELKSALATFQRLGAPTDIRETYELLGQEATAGTSARVVKSFMFTDIVRSTKLVEAIGDNAWGHLLQWHDKTLRSLFLTHGGEEVKQSGDGFFVAFAGPTDALACAVAIQRSLYEHRQAHGFAPQVRIGLHCGDATKKGRDYEGKEVHTAARIGALAGADEIIASKGLFSAADGAPQAAGSKVVSLKGIEEPVEVVTVLWQ